MWDCSLGYRKVAHSEADIGLAYHAALLDNSSMRVIGDARSNNPQRERSPSGSHELYIEYEKGALLLEVFERQSEIVLWQGVVSAVFDMNSPKKLRRMTVINSIRKMLDELPRKN